MDIKYFFLATIAAISLAGCNEGSQDESPEVTEAGVRSAISSLGTTYFNETNTENDYPLSDPFEDAADIARNDTYNCDFGGGNICEIDSSGLAAKSMVMRYEATETNPIKIYFNIPTRQHPDSPTVTEIPDWIYEGLNKINSAIGRDVFAPIETLNIEVWDSNYDMITWDVDYSAYPALNGGIVISLYTGSPSGTGGSECGNWTQRPHAGMGTHIVDHENHFSPDKGWSWINMISPDGVTCTANSDILAHELMHALGFAGHSGTDGWGHFAGFGIDGVFDERAQAALRTLYNNDAGSDPDNVQVYL